MTRDLREAAAAKLNGDAVLIFTQLIIGFSIFSGAILWFAYLFFLKEMEKTTLGLVACSILLAALAGLQIEHFRFLQYGVTLFDDGLYVFLLLATPPAFYFFSKEVLLPHSCNSWLELLNLVPLLLSFVLPTNIIAPVALAIGAAYSIWFASFVYGMRRHVTRYRFEVFFFCFFALLAILVLILGVAAPNIDDSIFYVAYANFTGIALVLIVTSLIIFPDLLSDFSAAAKITYSSSTLKGVNADAKVAHLKKLMSEEKIFQNENLSLASLAEALDLSGHQLSELINTQFNMGFSRFVREQRVQEARSLLENDNAASVLSISLQTGFRSQSNFYAAFHEITGMAPGTYRKSLENRPKNS